MSALRVVHEMPGRLRIRVPAGVDLAELAQAVRAEPGVLSATASSRTRSLLVAYEPEAQSAETLKNAIAHHGGLDVRNDGRSASPPLERQRRAPGSALPVAIRESASEVDRRVQRATRGLMGLSGLLPVALSVWAVSQLVRGRVNPLSWSSALWYAHSLFRDYSPRPPRE